MHLLPFKVIFMNLVITLMFELSVAEVEEMYSLFVSSDNVKNITESKKHLEDDANVKDDDNNDDDKNDANGHEDDDSKNISTKSALNWEELREKLHASLSYVTRCSRRFYAGICNEPVASVWTFTFSHQNCTERLGCRTSTVSNRFRTYSRCIFSCRPLIDVYTHILAYQETVLKTHDHDSDAHSDEFDSSDEEEGTLRQVKDARRKGLSTLQNLISSVKEDYGNFDEPILGFPESHDGEPPEEIQRAIPQDLDNIEQEYMDVNYDFNTGRHRLKGRVRGRN